MPKARSDNSGGLSFFSGRKTRKDPRTGAGSESSRFILNEVEVMSGFEPLNKAFAELSLTTWVHHRSVEVKKKHRIFNQLKLNPQSSGFP